MGKLPVGNDMFNSDSKLIVKDRRRHLANRKYLRGGGGCILNLCHASSFEYHWEPPQLVGQAVGSGNPVSDLLCLLSSRKPAGLCCRKPCVYSLTEGLFIYTCCWSDLWFGRPGHQGRRWQRHFSCWSPAHAGLGCGSLTCYPDQKKSKATNVI